LYIGILKKYLYDNGFSNMEEKLILKILDENRSGLTITEIVKHTGISRAAIRIALARLEGSESVNIRKIGMAKVYILNQNSAVEHAAMCFAEKSEHDKKYPGTNQRVKIISLLLVILIISILIGSCVNALIVNSKHKIYTLSEIRGKQLNIKSDAYTGVMDISKPKYISTTEEYHRSPNIIYDGNEYWLFYAKADTPAPAIRGYYYYNPDADSYSIYYRHNATMDALNSSPEIKLNLSDNLLLGPSKKVSAVFFQGKIYLYISAYHVAPTSIPTSIYYYVYDQANSNWLGPYTLLQDPNTPEEQFLENKPAGVGTNVDVAADEDWMYITYSDGNAGYITTFNGTDYGTGPNIIDKSEDVDIFDYPKINIMGDNIYLLGFKDYEKTDSQIFTAHIGPDPVFEKSSKPFSGITIIDMDIFNNGTTLFVTGSLSDSLSDHLIITKSEDNASSWMNPSDVTFAIYDQEGDHYFEQFRELWNDMECSGVSINGSTYIYFTTESDDSMGFGSAKIAYLPLDWDVQNYHYNTIQNAIYLSDNYESVSISNETYYESLVMDFPLTFIGHGTTLSPGYDKTAIIIRSDGVNITGLKITGADTAIAISPEIDPTLMTETIGITNNDLSGNNIGLVNNATGRIDATLNYWGDITGPSGNGIGIGSAVLGNTAYSPWYMSQEYSGTLYADVLYAMNDLTFGKIKNQNIMQDEIAADLNLIKNYPGNTVITWASSNVNILSNSGKVTRPNIDTPVYLLAIVSKAHSASLYKIFNMTVKAKEVSDEAAVDSEYDALTFESIRQENINESSIISDLNLSMDGINETAIAWKSSNTDIITNQGIVYMNSSIISVVLFANITKGDVSRIKEFDFNVMAYTDGDEEKIVYAKSKLTDRMILNGNADMDNILSSINLPSNISDPALADLTITWNTSAPETIILDDPKDEVVVLNDDDLYTDKLLSNANISIYHDPDTGTESGPILGSNIEFACGKCSDANFDNYVSYIGQYMPLCGYYKGVIAGILSNKDTICAKIYEPELMYEIDLKSYATDTCIDRGDGSCDQFQKTSYDLRPMFSKGDVLRSSSADKHVILRATLQLNNRIAVKYFPLTIKMKIPTATFDENGDAVISNDSTEYVIDNSNRYNITSIDIPEYINTSDVITMNLAGLMNPNAYNLTLGMRSLSLIRNTAGGNKYIIDLFEDTMIFTGDSWNGLFMLPTELKAGDYSVDQGTVNLIIEAGWAYEFTFSHPVRITFVGVGNNKMAAYAHSGNVLTKIANRCLSATDYSNIIGNNDCYFNDGDNLIIWTYHFTKFAAYTPATPVVETPGRSTTKTSATGGAGGTGGGAGGMTSLSACTESWVCENWSPCIKNISTRSCTDINNCGTSASKPSTELQCTDSTINGSYDLVINDSGTIKNNLTGNIKSTLFDIVLEILQPPTKEDQSLSIKVSLINFGLPGKVDAKLHYTVKDSQNLTVFELYKNQSVETQLEFIDKLDLSALKKGDYNLIIDLKYPGQTEPASAEKSFSVQAPSLSLEYIVLFVVFGLLLIFIIAVFLKRKQNSTQAKQ